MGRVIKGVLILSFVMGLLAAIIHQTSPSLMTSLMASPAIKSVISNLQNFIHRVYNAKTDVSAQKAKKGNKKKIRERIFTRGELKKYDGQEGNKGPYLAILGRVYDVRKGKKHYGTGGGYEFFSGRDGSRAFVSGDFTEEGLIDDVSGLTSADYIGLDEWIKFYETDYKYIGKLVGRYYTEMGAATPYNNEVQKWISEAYEQKDSENEEKKLFPPCNSEWSQEVGARVWCTAKSGGIEREWVGVPRKFYRAGQSKPRCACIRTSGPPSHDPASSENRGDLDNPNLEEYPECQPDQPSCLVGDA